MAITLKVTKGSTFEGASTNLTSYEVTEDATPIAASDSSGGTGQITLGMLEDRSSLGSNLLIGSEITLEDGTNGRTSGQINALSAKDELSITADSRLNKFNVERGVGPFHGTLEGAIFFYASLAGIDGNLFVEESVRNIPVVCPAFTGNLWVAIKEFCAVYEVEMALISGNIVVRPLRTREVQVISESVKGWDISSNNIAQSLEVYYYDNNYQESGLAYPDISQSDPTPQIYQVDAGETIKFDIEVPAYLTYVSPTQCVDAIDSNSTSEGSVYTVIDSEGKAITAKDWRNHGGDISVEIDEEDLTILHVTIRGAITPSAFKAKAPFKIATNATKEYPALYIRGDGIFFNKKLITVQLGNSIEQTGQVVGTTIDSKYINTVSQAYAAALNIASEWTGVTKTVEVSTTVANRRGDVGSVTFPAYTLFNAQWGDLTYAEFDAEYGDWTFAEFSAMLRSQVEDNFENQAFGNVAGSRLKFRDSMYRIKSATINQSGITYSAEGDTLFSDFNEVWAGKTFADFNSSFGDKTFLEFGVIPLWQ